MTVEHVGTENDEDSGLRRILAAETRKRQKNIRNHETTVRQTRNTLHHLPSLPRTTQ